MCLPVLASRDHRLRPLGASVAVSAAVSYVVFWYAFASVWCFFAAVLSLYLAYVLFRLPGPRVADPGLRPAPSN